MSNAPKLRFPGFSDNWVTKKLGDVAGTVSGLTYSPKDIRANGILVLRSSNVKNGQLSFGDNVYVSNSLKYNESQRGDILICVRNGSQSLIGKNAYIDRMLESTTHGAFMTVLRSKDNLFIRQLLQTDQYRRQVSADLGARINSINNSQLLRYRFRFPSKAEQKKIAEFLEAVDGRITKTEKKLELLQQYKKGVIQKIFTQQVRFKNQDGNTPLNWKEQKLNDILAASSKAPVSDTSKYRKITVRLRKQGINFTEQSRRMADIRPFYVRRSGEIIIGKQNYFNGSIAIIQPEFDGSICSNAIMSFSVNDTADTRFVYEYISQDSYLARREALANGTGQKELSEKDFLDFTILTPPIKTQKRIARFLDALDAQIKKEEARLALVEQWKKSLLQSMLV